MEICETERNDNSAHHFHLQTPEDRLPGTAQLLPVLRYGRRADTFMQAGLYSLILLFAATEGG